MLCRQNLLSDTRTERKTLRSLSNEHPINKVRCYNPVDSQGNDHFIAMNLSSRVNIFKERSIDV